MNQSDLFLSGEANEWFKRNREHLGKRDPVGNLLNLLPLVRPRHILEVGCANGWRLLKLKERYKCRVSGIEPSYDACLEAAASGLDDVANDTFGRVQWLGGTFDMIIFAFCLYVTSPSDWLRIVAEADRLLSDGGYLVIHDFARPKEAFKKVYEHRPELWSYHVDFAKMWLSHPYYEEYDGADFDDERVTILRKDQTNIKVEQ